MGTTSLRAQGDLVSKLISRTAESTRKEMEDEVDTEGILGM